MGLFEMTTGGEMAGWWLLVDGCGIAVGIFIWWILYRQQNPAKNAEGGDGPSSGKYRPTEIRAKNPLKRYIGGIIGGFILHLILIFLGIPLRSIHIMVGSVFLLFTWYCATSFRKRLISQFHYGYMRLLTPKHIPLVVHAGIIITQLPVIEKERRKDKMQFNRVTAAGGKNLMFNAERMESWLVAMGTKGVGVELIKQNGIVWKIYTGCQSYEGAEDRAKELQQKFESRFPGLQCTPFIRPITKYSLGRKILWKNTKRHPATLQPYRIKLAKPPYREKLPLLQSLTALLQTNELPLQINLTFTRQSSYTKHRIERRLRHQSYDPAMKRELEPLWVGDCYRTQIGVSLPSGEERRKYDIGAAQQHQLRDHLQSLDGEFRNLRGKGSKIVPLTPKHMWETVKLQVTEGSLISPYGIDADFALPLLKRAKKLPHRHLSPQIQKVPPLTALDVGWIVQHGCPTQQHAYVDLDSLTMNALIAGTPGVGKSVLISQIVNKIGWQCPEVGILIINTSKKGEERHYPDFRVVKYGEQKHPVLKNPSTPTLSAYEDAMIDDTEEEWTWDESLEVEKMKTEPLRLPYGFIPEGSDVTRVLKRISRNLTAVSGLLDFAYRYFYTPMLRYYQLQHDLPPDIGLVYALALRYLHRNPYAGKEQQNLHQAISMRGREFLEDPTFCATVAQGSWIPRWLEGFLTRGEKIFLDFTGCDKITQQFLILSLLQHIDTLTASRNMMDTVTLQNLIVFDEAHCIFEKPQGGDVKSDAHIRQGAVNRVIKPYLLEFRSRGVGSLISDQRPSILMESLQDQTALKFLFRIGGKCAKLYSTHAELQEFLMQQEQFKCVVMDGSRGELYQIATHPE